MDRIELRSEMVRKIIGDIPSGFIRHGISIITLVLILIFLACYFIPYEGKKNVIEYIMKP